MDLVLRYLPWLLPPLIGAAIGYITNAIAITMLFRPHNEKRLLSIKIPMTPGIIPKQRYELSESVGRMVSKELLTEDAVRKQIRSKSFLQSVDSSIKTFVDLIIETPVLELKEQFVRSHLKIKSVKIKEEGSVFKTFLPELISNFLSSEGLSNILENLLDKGILYIENKTPLQLFPGRKKKIVEKIVSILSSDKFEEKFIEIIDKWLENAVHENYHLSVILTEKNIGRIISITEKIFTRLFPHFIHFLNTDDVKKELEVHGRRLLEDIINRLNRIQRFLVSAGQYDRTLDDNMKGIVEDTIKNLKDYGEKEKNINNMAEGLKRRLLVLSQASAGEIVAGWDGDLFQDIHNFENSLFELIRNPVIKENFESWLISFIDKYGSNPFNQILTEWFSLSFFDIKSYILKFIFQKKETFPENPNFTISTNFFNKIFNIITKEGKLSVGHIINITPSVKNRMSDGLTSTLIGIVDDKVPSILESIDVNTLVVDKIDTLNMEKVEKLILDIVKKQLRWINVFGALLGSIIGGAQLLLNMFM